MKIDVRVVAATNKDLKALVGARRVPRGPVLAARGGADPGAAAARAQARTSRCSPRTSWRAGAAPRRASAGDEARYPTRITAKALARLCAYHWPGNIRELENVLSRAAILCDGEMIRSEDLDLAGLSVRPAPPAAGAAAPRRPDDSVDRAGSAQGHGRATRCAPSSAQAILDALERVGRLADQGGRAAGHQPRIIYNKLKEYEIADMTFAAPVAKAVATSGTGRASSRSRSAASR